MMHDFFSPWYSSPITGMFFPFMLLVLPLLIFIAVWTIAIKGYALWHAAKNGQKEWFVALLILNTIGVLELIYLIWFCPDHHLKHKRHHSSHHAHPEVSSKPQE
jgi:hypothetical protein